MGPSGENLWFIISVINMVIGQVFVSGRAVEHNSPIVIAHRGASGYLPEHTLPAKALAYGQDADYLEQDVVLSKDNVPIVLHDIFLDEVSNVAVVFPGKNRSNGRFYAIDFTAAEIKGLRASERFNWNTGNPIFPTRFPLNQSNFQLVTLAEELEFVAGLNQQANVNQRKPIGIYVEIKEPEFHKNQNRANFSEIVLELLRKYNYTKKTDPVFLQSFDIEELQRIRVKLGSDLKLVGLLTENNDRSEFSETDYTYWTSEVGIEDMARFVDGIGPHYSQLFQIGTVLEPSTLFHYARKNNLFIHPYTFRSDRVVEPFLTLNKMFEFFLGQLEVDGLFIDQPDKAVQYLRNKANQSSNGPRISMPWCLLLLLGTTSILFQTFLFSK